MGLKRGYIVEDDTPVTRGPTKIRRFRLSSGDPAPVKPRETPWRAYY